jgi:hypothetical protein
MCRWLRREYRAMRRLYQVSLPHATFGFEVCDGVVVRAAPIAKWAVGKTADWVISYYLRYADRYPVPWIPIRIVWEES